VKKKGHSKSWKPDDERLRASLKVARRQSLAKEGGPFRGRGGFNDEELLGGKCHQINSRSGKLANFEVSLR